MRLDKNYIGIYCLRCVIHYIYIYCCKGGQISTRMSVRLFLFVIIFIRMYGHTYAEDVNNLFLEQLCLLEHLFDKNLNTLKYYTII